MGSMMKNTIKQEIIVSPFKKFTKKRLKEIIAEADTLICGINAALPPAIRGFGDAEDAAQHEWLLPDKSINTKIKKESRDNEKPTEGSDVEGDDKEEIKIEGKTKNEAEGRAKTIDELLQRYNTLKGKKVDYAGRVLKKGLKNRIKKKQKLELRKKQKQLHKEQNSTEVKTDAKPAVNELKLKVESKGPILFNKIAFTDNEELEKRRQPISDPKRALQVIEKKKKKLMELESKGKEEKVKHIKKKEQWETAIQRAEGIKVKDNVELLKKTIKRKEKVKKRSAKKWEERQENLQKKKEDAQKKRKENIAAKIKKIKQTKIKRSINKGRVVL